MWPSVHPEKGRIPLGDVPAGKAPNKHLQFSFEALETNTELLHIAYRIH